MESPITANAGDSLLFGNPLRMMLEQPGSMPSTQESLASMNGLHPDLAKNREIRGIMKNGRPRPSAVRDYPDGCARNTGKKEGESEARSDKAQGDSNGKAIDGSKPEVPSGEKPVKAAEAMKTGQPQAQTADKQPRPAKPDKTVQSEPQSSEEELPKAGEAAKSMQPKSQVPKAGESAKPVQSQPPRDKRGSVRDYPVAVGKNVGQKLDHPKAGEATKLVQPQPQQEPVRDIPEAVGKNAGKTDSSRADNTQGTGSGKNAGKKDSSRADNTQGTGSGKKSKGSKPELPAAGKSPKAAKLPSRVKPQPKSKESELVQPEPKGQEPELVVGGSHDITPKNGKRKSKSSTPSETKRVRRSGGKPPKLTSGSADGSDPRKAVIETLRLFDSIRRRYVQDEEIHGKQGRGRADLRAGSTMKEQGILVNDCEKKEGPFPGVEVGDQFYFRMEICRIGLHGPLQGGIEYLTAKESKWSSTPVAISIISTGGHDDDRENGDELIYTGQGGRSADNKQNEDQKLERGNLAMDGSQKYGVPVRVIRGIKDASSPAGKIYTYDGLFTVVELRSVKGDGGFEEFKFKLRRIPGQPELGSSLIKLSNQLKQNPSSREGLLLGDISKGKESQPICVVNTVDDEQGPAPFEYSTKVKYSSDIDKLESPVGCDCKGACSTSSECLCFSRNGNAFAYLNNGVLVKEKDIIYECGSHCKCSSNCRNRVTQKGLKFRLEVFKTGDRGWGVRSLESIPAGSFVCEYTGKLVIDMETVNTMSNKEHLLDLRRVPESKVRWGDLSAVDLGSQHSGSQNSETVQDVARPEFVLDASQTGNVARFINHSCFPNLLVQKVLSEHQDARFPQIMLFSMDNIPPFRELTFDYGCEGSEDLGMEVKSKDCLCGTTDCRGQLYY